MQDHSNLTVPNLIRGWFWPEIGGAILTAVVVALAIRLKWTPTPADPSLGLLIAVIIVAAAAGANLAGAAADAWRLGRIQREWATITGFSASDLAQESVQAVLERLHREWGRSYDLPNAVKQVRDEFEEKLNRRWAARWVALFLVLPIGFALGMIQHRGASAATPWVEVFFPMILVGAVSAPCVALLTMLETQGRSLLREWERSAEQDIGDTPGSKPEPATSGPGIDVPSPFPSSSVGSRGEPPWNPGPNARAGSPFDQSWEEAEKQSQHARRSNDGKIEEDDFDDLPPASAGHASTSSSSEPGAGAAANSRRVKSSRSNPHRENAPKDYGEDAYL